MDLTADRLFQPYIGFLTLVGCSIKAVGLRSWIYHRWVDGEWFTSKLKLNSGFYYSLAGRCNAYVLKKSYNDHLNHKIPNALMLEMLQSVKVRSCLVQFMIVVNTC